MTETTYVVNEDVHGLPAELLDQLCRVVLLLGLFDAALKVAGKGLLAPRAAYRVRDGRERGARAVLLRPAQDGGEVERERAVPAHGVPEDGLAGQVLLRGQ